MRVKCGGVGVTLRSGSRPVEALHGLSFESGEAEFLSILGPSGCGKTTLLKCIAGLSPVTEGLIERLPGPGDRNGRILIVQQERSLFPWMTAIENAAYGLKTMGVGKGEREARAAEWLARFGLDGRQDCYPDALSTGMKQRVAVVRCFLTEPAMLLMDEPFAALDAQTRLALQQELLALWEPGHRSVIFVTHDIEEALLLSDRILVLGNQPGHIVSEVRVNLPRPRPPATVLSPEFIRLKGIVYDALGLEKGTIMHA